MHPILLALLLLSPSRPGDKTVGAAGGSAETSGKGASGKEVSPAAPPAPAENATSGTVLGKTNAESGEARRNENVQFNQIDNNAKKELTQRMGTTATMVTEFKPERTYFGSEFGEAGASGIHPAALKPTPSLHGSVFATHGDSAFTARSFFQVGGVKPARDNQYGFNFGTRISKNSFLSVDASEQRISGFVNGNILVPLDAERTPRTTDPAAARLIQKFLNAYPKDAPNRTDIDRRFLNTNSRQEILSDNFTIQLDHKLSARDRVTARHSFAGQNVDAFQFVAGQNPITATKSNNARLGWNRAVSPGTQLDVTLGFDRNHTQLDAEPNAVGPQVQIGTSYEKLGPSSNIPLNRVQNRYRTAAMFSSRLGNHTFAFGGDLTRAQFNSREVSSFRGNYYFRSDFGKDAITNFLEGHPTRYSGGFGDPQRYHRGWEQSFFAGDTWRVRPDLTFSYGVRFNPITGLHEKTQLDEMPLRCDCDNLGPRFGFAYRLPGKAGVIRSSWSLHFGDIFASTLQQTRWNPPNTQKYEAMVPDFLNPASAVARGPNARAIVTEYPETLQAPYTHHYNFIWEAALPGNWRMQTGYVGSRSKKLFMLWHLNRAGVVPGIAQTTLTVQDRRPDPRYFDYRALENSSNGYFDAGRISVIGPSWNGLTLDASYWMSKAIDTGASYLNTAAGDDARQGYSQTANPVAEDLKGVSAFDQKHAFLVRLSYATPKLAARHLDSWFGRWNLNSIFLAKSGMPFTVITGSDSAGSGNVDGVNGDRPNLLDASILGMAINQPDTRLPRAAFGFIRPTDAAGNLGSSTFRRGGIRNLNASLSRTWTMAGEKKLTFRAESLNLFNTPQFAEPNPDLSSPAFGKITNSLNDGRVIRFHLRLAF